MALAGPPGGTLSGSTRLGPISHSGLAFSPLPRMYSSCDAPCNTRGVCLRHEGKAHGRGASRAAQGRLLGWLAVHQAAYLCGQLALGRNRHVHCPATGGLPIAQDHGTHQPPHEHRHVHGRTAWTRARVAGRRGSADTNGPPVAPRYERPTCRSKITPRPGSQAPISGALPTNTRRASDCKLEPGSGEGGGGWVGTKKRTRTAPVVPGTHATGS
jgi:hypothetical protein